jgi:hypothetical protein
MPVLGTNWDLVILIAHPMRGSFLSHSNQKWILDRFYVRFQADRREGIDHSLLPAAQSLTYRRDFDGKPIDSWDCHPFCRIFE